MKSFSPTIIDKTLSFIKDSLQSVRTTYREKLAESESLNREIVAINQAARTREDLEQALCTAVNRYVDYHGKALVTWCARYGRVLHEDKDEAEIAIDGLASSFIGYTDQSGLPALLRESLLAGAKQLAATVEWPENAMDPDTRQQRLSQLTPRRDELSKELDEMRARAEQEGVTL